MVTFLGAAIAHGVGVNGTIAPGVMLLQMIICMLETKHHGVGNGVPSALQNGQIAPLWLIQAPAGTPVKLTGWPGAAVKSEHQGAFTGFISPAFRFSLFSLDMDFLSWFWMGLHFPRWPPSGSCLSPLQRDALESLQLDQLLVAGHTGEVIKFVRGPNFVGSISGLHHLSQKFHGQAAFAQMVIHRSCVH